VSGKAPKRTDTDVTPCQQTGADGYTRLTKAFLVVIILIGLVGCKLHSSWAPTDPDEFEHLHAAWLWNQGIEPYTGFFEHHPPLYWALLRPLVASADRTDLMSLMLHARALSWLVVVGVVISSWWFFSELLGRKAAWAATGFFAMYCSVAQVVFQVRPDMASLLLLIMGSTLGINALGLGRRTNGHGLLKALIGGVLIGTSICMLPKAIFWTGGLLSGLLIFAIWRMWRDNAKRELLLSGLLVLGIAIPGVLQVVWVLLANDFATFWYHNVEVNRRLAGSVLKNLPVVAVSWSEFFRWPMLAAPLAVLGIARIVTTRELFAWVRSSVVLLLLIATALLIFLGNGPWPQYHIPFLVIVAGLAGLGFSDALDRFSPGGRSISLGLLGGLAVVWFFVFVVSRLTRPHSPLAKDIIPMQMVLDSAGPKDTYVAMQHWNPVFLMDADPKIFTKLVTRYDLQTLGEFAKVIKTKRPRFILGFQMPVWTSEGASFRLTPSILPFVKESYRPLDRTGYILERYR